MGNDQGEIEVSIVDQADEQEPDLEAEDIPFKKAFASARADDETTQCSLVQQPAIITTSRPESQLGANAIDELTRSAYNDYLTEGKQSSVSAVAGQ